MVLASVGYITAGSMVALAIALGGWLLVHLRNHPVKADINKEFDRLRGPDGMQWKETCNERTKRIEASIKSVDEKVEKGFEDLKCLIEKQNRRQ